MSQVLIDFAPHRSVSAIASAALALLACLLLVWQWRQQTLTLSALREEAARIQARGEVPPSERRATPAPLPKSSAEAINSAIASLNVPWPKLLAAVEDSRPENVWLLSLAANPDKRSLKLQAEALDDKPLYEFAQALESTGDFSRLEPLDQQKTDAEQGGRVRLSLEATWQP
ncbi:hypothetical protein [Niveibacterium terrae]|uniref:hypothetical protein n=1 Tax=Niveibacterium terrae TaxID=3373598 RepID=UPI003A8E7C60